MMPQQKRSTAAKNTYKNDGAAKKQSGSASKKASERKAEKALPKNEGMRRELTALIMAGTAILLFAFLISGSSENAGIIGKAAVTVLLGTLGIGAWILPPVLIIGTVYLIMEKQSILFKIRAVFMLILFLTVLAFIHSFGGAAQYDGLSLPAFIAYAFRHGSSSNGGLFGAFLYTGLYKLLGTPGCYIVLVLIIIIMTMLISGGSLIGLIRRIINYVDDMCGKYYYDDYEDEDTEDEPLPEKPKSRRRAAKMQADTDISEAVPDNTAKTVALDIKKGSRRDNKIKLITDSVTYSDTDSPASETDLTGYISMPEIKHRHKNDDSDIQSKYSDIFDDEPDNDTVDTQSMPMQAEAMFFSRDEEPAPEVSEEEKKTTDAKSPDNDLPPWEDTYSDEDKPTIIRAEKAKLVDSLEVEKKKSEYKFPKLEFLGTNPRKSTEKTKAEIYKKARKLEESLSIFNVEAKVNNISIGPTVTRYELTPSTGTKVSAVTKLENDIMFSMAAESIIIEAPIPGKSAIGIEIPNDTRESVYFSEVLRSEQFQKFKSKIGFGLGKDITGDIAVYDLAKMPHLLVAGTTGSGKSVCINTLIMSILYKATPDDVKMIMVDPKMVELSVYNDIPHLLLPVVTEPEKAAGALNWAVIEMERRYKLLANTGTRNLEGYNQKVPNEEKLGQIVIIIDELADLMMVVGKEIETSICRLAQKARAAGMHLVLATQRPSADVLTGLIRSNVPSRIAFKVSGAMDSRIILDSTGAEKLLGRGDMLFKTSEMPKPMRIQGAFVTDEEVERVVNYIKTDEPNYDENIINEIARASISVSSSDSGDDTEDPMTDEVLEWIVKNPKCASAGKVQRHFRIGFNRASRIIEALEDRGILGPTNGSQPREVFMDKYELRERKERYDSYGDQI